MPAGSSVLIADAEREARGELDRFFVDQGCTTYVAETGAQALGIVKVRKLRLTLIDLEIPDMGGLEVLRAIIQIDRMVPCIITARDRSKETKLEAISAGAATYLTKPYDPAILAAAVSRILLKK